MNGFQIGSKRLKVQHKRTGGDDDSTAPYGFSHHGNGGNNSSSGLLMMPRSVSAQGTILISAGQPQGYSLDHMPSPPEAGSGAFQGAQHVHASYASIQMGMGAPNADSLAMHQQHHILQQQQQQHNVIYSNAQGAPQQQYQFQDRGDQQFS